MADNPLGVDHVGEGKPVVAGEHPLLDSLLHRVGVLLVVVDIEELGRRLHRFPPAEQGKDGIGLGILGEVLVHIHQLGVVVGGYGGLDGGGEVGVNLLQLLQLGEGGHRLLEEAGGPPQLVVVLSDPVHRNIDHQVEVGAGIEDALHRLHHPGGQPAVGGDADVADIVVPVEDPDDLGEVLAQERFPPGGKEEEEVVHRTGDLLYLVDGQLVGPRVDPPEQAVLAVGVALFGDEEDQVDRGDPALVEDQAAVFQITQGVHINSFPVVNYRSIG